MQDIDRAIEHAKRQLEQMIDLAPQVMLLVDRKGSVVRTNKALLDLLGLKSYKDVLDKPLAAIFPHAGGKAEGGKFFATLTGEFMGKFQDADVDLAARGRATLRFCAVSSGKEAEASVVMVENVSEEKAAAAEVEQEHKKQATEAVVGALMHVINQPLTVITVKAHLMKIALEKGTAVPAEVARDLEDIMAMTMGVSETLRRVEKPQRFVTQPYLEGYVRKDILDIEQSSTPGGDAVAVPDHDIYSTLPFAAEVGGVLIEALEVHEPGAMHHARRTGEYALAIGARLGWDKKDREVLRHCALLHDVGKLGVACELLRKTSPLSLEETVVIHGHAGFGWKLLRCFPFLTVHAEVAHSHHEWFDGCGYPRGLAGSAIDLRARVVSVADTFDVLRDGRPYSPGVAPEQAAKIIHEGSGSQFDPDVVAAFNRCLVEDGGLFLANADGV